MTKLEILTEAGRRLGDTSTQFLAVLSSLFDFVQRDLARDELVDDLTRRIPFAITDADTAFYDTRTITGLSAPFYPLRILSLEVVGWGPLSPVPQAENNMEFERAKALTAVQSGGDTFRDHFRLWRVYPNRETLEVWPAVSSQAVDEAGGFATLVYLAPLASLADGDEVGEVADEDLETIVYGIVARASVFKEEVGMDYQTAFALYQDGKRAMFGRKFNSAPARISMDPLWGW